MTRVNSRALLGVCVEQHHPRREVDAVFSTLRPAAGNCYLELKGDVDHRAVRRYYIQHSLAAILRSLPPPYFSSCGCQIVRSRFFVYFPFAHPNAVREAAKLTGPCNKHINIDILLQMVAGTTGHFSSFVLYRVATSQKRQTTLSAHNACGGRFSHEITPSFVSLRLVQQ